MLTKLSQGELNQFIEKAHSELFNHSTKKIGKSQCSLIKNLERIYHYNTIVADFNYYEPFMVDKLIEMNLTDDKIVIWNEVLRLMPLQCQKNQEQSNSEARDMEEEADKTLELTTEDDSSESNFLNQIKETSESAEAGLTIAKLFTDSIGFFCNPIKNSKYFKQFNEFCKKTQQFIKNKYFYISQLLGINLILDSIERKKTQSKNWRIFINVSIALFCLIVIGIFLSNSIPPTLNPIKFITKNLQNIYK